MVNLEYKLTVDDLIVEYMMYKVKKGYAPNFLASEFMEFLSFFESKMEVEDSLYEKEKLFQRFFERKSKSDWSIIKNLYPKEVESQPHMDMVYSPKDNDYIIKANYKLGEYDRSIITTYFMNYGRGEYDDAGGQVLEIRSMIGKYLLDMPKRKIDESIEIDDNELLVGKYIASSIICNIWDSHIQGLIEAQEWPRQCDDINKYLLKQDLAPVIGLRSIKKKLLDLYNVFSKRIAVLYHEDPILKIQSHTNSYLAVANYELLTKGYEKTVGIAFGPYQKSLDIDVTAGTFRESHEIEGIYNWDEDPDIKTTTTSIANESIKKLVKLMDKQSQTN